MGEFKLLDHPLIAHKIGFLRDADTDSDLFRRLTKEITTLMAYEATRNMRLEDREIVTPVAPAVIKRLAEPSVTIVAVLRAGMGMVDGFLNLIPTARVGFIGLYRDHMTLQPIDYYLNLPAGMDETFTILIDPMLATAGSAIASIETLKRNGVKTIQYVCLIASKEGVAALHEAYPEIDIYAAALDETLNENGYIVPGLGDAGDRLYDTI